MTKRTVVALAYTAGIAGAVFGFFVFVMWLFRDSGGPPLPAFLVVVFVVAFFVLWIAGMALAGEAVAAVGRRVFRLWLEPRWPAKKVSVTQKALLFVPSIVLFGASCYIPEVVSTALHVRYGSTITIGDRRITLPLTWTAGPWVFNCAELPINCTEFPKGDYAEVFDVKGRGRTPGVSIWSLLGHGPVANATFSNSGMSHDISALRAYWASDGWTESRRVLMSAGRELECWELRSASQLRIFCVATQSGDRFRANFEIQTYYSRPYVRYMPSTATTDASAFYRMLETAESAR